MAMKTGRLAGAFVALGLSAMAWRGSTAVGQSAAAIAIDEDDIGGVVTGPNGPEAGVWVIAETTDLPTKFVRIVVTDDQGRYLLPDLPKANYSVWVRGYGLVDSPKVQATPGKPLNLTAVAAPSPRAAAQYYPAGYWFSLLQVPAKSEFPGTGAGGNGISPNMKSQAEWLRNVKSGGCTACHQLGNKATREIPAALGTFPSIGRRVGRGASSRARPARSMIGGLNQLGPQRALTLFADWTDRIARGRAAAGAAAAAGLERNVVITQWDWADPEGVPARRGLDRSAQPDASTPTA